ncbi:TRAP transporter substrate-binding protein DctP [Marinospirillum alkaliphilum]|uniref:TRAP-type C4-dicarboxylate transport system, substrate-binding protein n=1 Tax=Marinospirillum alkaliphilum DSM 21637 TaxID=1122209 RepID=A0A1K1Y5R1_9GAMM|nr:TRAP transporter substrate-binding protein DctP [Marinospirillum alkaliphilum]SFX56915.1 TRAP-type C4-dicarboxylate transport system, substrate-binding protein [Marinospirillum alkaliphilum DSM 21637]
MMLKKVLATALAGVMLAGLAACGGDKDTETASATAGAAGQNWRYAHEEFEGDVQDVFAQKFREYIEANSPHTVQVFRFGELGESDDIMEQTQAGILQFVNQSPGFTGSLIPEAQIFFIPYLLPVEDEQIVEFFRSSVAINEMFTELYAEQGLELLTMYPEGEMVVTADTPVRSPEDFRGKNIRTMTNPLLAETYRAFGATPTPLAWGEVYGGLQTNIIQGQENPIFWIQSGGLYEVSPNLIFTGHGQFTTAMMANQAFFNGLSAEDQQLVRDATAHAFDYITEYVPGLGDRMLEKILEASDQVTVTRLTAEERQAFMDRAPQVEARFIEMTGERGAALLEQFKADLEAVVGE